MRRMIVLLASSALLLGQDSTDMPVQVKRIPPANTQEKSIAPLPQQYPDIGAQIRALQDIAAGLGSAGIQAPSVSGGNSGSGAAAAVPRDFHPPNAQMTPTALEAVRLSQHWAQEKNIPAPGPDGRVIYSFGAGPVTVVCAPLRVCTMELQSGERIQGDPQIGDAVRWNISLASFGVAEDSTPVIVLKPQQPGLDTTLLITTDRRAYYARLISQSDAYVERVGFAYAENDTAKWRTQVSAQNVSLKSRSELPALIAIEKMHFDYRIKGGSENIRPVRVFDDGAKTYIQMPQEMQHREAPVLVVVGADGKGQMVNYRVNDQTYVVDRIFDRAELVLGSGKKARKVEVIRERKG